MLVVVVLDVPNVADGVASNITLYKWNICIMKKHGVEIMIIKDKTRKTIYLSLTIMFLLLFVTVAVITIYNIVRGASHWFMINILAAVTTGVSCHIHLDNYIQLSIKCKQNEKVEAQHE